MVSTIVYLHCPGRNFLLTCHYTSRRACLSPRFSQLVESDDTLNGERQTRCYVAEGHRNNVIDIHTGIETACDNHELFAVAYARLLRGLFHFAHVW